MVPDVVTRGKDVHTALQKLVGGVLGDSEPTRGILTVGDDQIDALLDLQLRQQGADRIAPRFADNVTYHQDAHVLILLQVYEKGPKFRLVPALGPF